MILTVSPLDNLFLLRKTKNANRKTAIKAWGHDTRLEGRGSRVLPSLLDKGTKRDYIKIIKKNADINLAEAN
jgi:hypothetical protein